MRWELPDGVEVLADEARLAVAHRAVAARADLVERALRFLRGWLHEEFGPDRGGFELVTLEVPASREESADVVLRFVFTLAADPHEYGSTRGSRSWSTNRSRRSTPPGPSGCASGSGEGHPGNAAR